MGKNSFPLRVKQPLAKIQVYNQQDRIKSEISKKEIVSVIEFVLSQLKRTKQFHFTVIFIDDEKIRDLNKRFRQVDQFTDVLVFPYSSKEAEIYISAERAYEQAEEYHQTYREEILRLIIHGVLHCLGWRDKNSEERKKMWAIQEKILNSFFLR